MRATLSYLFLFFQVCMFLISCQGEPEYKDYDIAFVECGYVRGTNEERPGPCMMFFCSGLGTACKVGTVHYIPYSLRLEKFSEFKEYYDRDELTSYFENEELWKDFFPDYVLSEEVQNLINEGYYKLYIGEDSTIVVYHDSLSRENIVTLWKWNQDN